jgi:acetate kinase
MGFSPLEGVPMTTRSGSIDPGALLYVLRERGLDVATIDHALNFESGLAALGGAEGMAELEALGTEEARLAIDVFTYRVAAAVAAMSVACGGLDALVFTAGIGENSARVRRAVCARLGFLGVEVDAERNASASPDCEISSGSVEVHVIRTREELVAARAARAALGR